MDIRLHILEEITNGFSVDSRIGRGGYGDVYKGVYNGEMIAVKLLHVDTVQGLDDRQFNNEVGNLLRVKHPNVVRLLGYCYETRSKYVEHNGEHVFGKHIYRVLCFEYLQGGSLDMHLHAPSLEPDWSTRYNIIKGVCEGLNFLHRCEPPIWHLDLKPANILLDSSMESKVTDLGLSRLFSRSHTHVTERIVGTQKYMPPEFMKHGIVSSKNDVFSLGVVIIEIITGPTGYSDFSEMGGGAQFMQKVLTKWSTVIEATSKYRSEELRQVKICIGLAIQCVDSERNNRPTIAEILEALNMTETHSPKRETCPRISVPGFKGIPKERARSTLTQENIPSLHEVSDHRETTAWMKARVVGREKEKHEIVALLSGITTGELTFLPIYGIGGIGKTTMAQLVFNDIQFKEYSRVWIYVSQTFDLKKIGKSIITQLSGKKCEDTELQMIENNLQKLLSGKSVLIVLDDLWESSQAQNLVSMLNLGEGSKMVVVVTTREESIAQKIHINKVKPYKLAALTDDICWTIIKNKSSFECRADRAQLELTGKDIAKKCGGLPLAAQSIGYMLNTMECDGWFSVNNSEIGDVLASEESSPYHVPASLQLSYHHMNPYLKLCFAYCATFPKGHKIAKEDLALQWVALGLIEPSRLFSNIQTSHQYIRHLFGMSFLEHPKSQWTTDDRFLIMHDLVHDLARSVLADKNNIESPSCRYLWLTNHRNLFKSSMSPLGKIMALHFLDRDYLQLHAEAFSPAKCLRVLDLSRCFAQELHYSIFQLKQLRYLDASCSGSPGFSYCAKFLIPEDLGSLNKLQYLNLSYRRILIGKPEVISKLMELQYLNISHCDGYYLLDNPSANQRFIDCIGTLPNLEQLDLSYNDYGFCVPESFSSLKKLNLLGCNHIAILPEKVAKVDTHRLFGLLDHPVKNRFPVCAVDTFFLNGRAVDSESRSSLLWLKHTNPDVLGITNLENVKSVEEARNIRLMGKQRIEELSLGWSGGVSSVEHMELLTELVPPSSVKNFKIIGYKNVRLPRWFISKNLPNLVSLVLWDLSCSSLPTLVQLPNLRNIVLGFMDNLEEFNTTYSMGEDGENELTLAKLEYLEIYCCPNLRFRPCPPRAVHCYIYQSDNVLSSWGECASSTTASSSSCHVSKLKVEDSRLPLHRWRLLHQLHGLSDLTISHCHDLTISPHIARSFTSLESLSLGYLGQEKMLEWSGVLTSLRQLNFDRYYDPQEWLGVLTSLPEWLGELTMLKTLKISSCKDIISLPQSILTNLQELHISDCPYLYEWCKLEENQIKLAHIKDKFIYDGGSRTTTL